MPVSKLGQHFLVNRPMAEKIVTGFLPVQGPILEIGPGKGVLTELLVKYREENPLVLVEIDEILYCDLKKRYENVPKLDILNRDILKIDLKTFFPTLNPDFSRNDTGVNLVGNVPYYISKELMDWVIRQYKAVKKGMFMMQKEFVDKLTAQAGTSHVNAQSTIFRLLFRCEKLSDVQPGSFSPPPKVKSTVFSFVPHDVVHGEGIDAQDLYIFLGKCFGNRRKTLVNNLAGEFGEEKLRDLFQELRINLKIRAEQLQPGDFKNLYLQLKSHTVV